MVEVWHDTMYSNYLVSSLGRVKNVRTGHILTGTPNSKGYLCVTVIDDYGIQHSCPIHRLVAKAFLSGTGTVDHKDNNKANNAVSNLQWLTSRENTQKEQGHRICIDKIIYPSIRAAAEALHISTNKIYAVGHGTG